MLVIMVKVMYGYVQLNEGADFASSLDRRLNMSPWLRSKTIFLKTWAENSCQVLYPRSRPEKIGPCWGRFKVPHLYTNILSDALICVYLMYASRAML
jgi:hypothetical protein